MRTTIYLVAIVAIVPWLLKAPGFSPNALAEDAKLAEETSPSDQLEDLSRSRKWEQALELAKKLSKSAKAEERKELKLQITHFKAQIALEKIAAAFKKSPSIRPTLKKIDKLINKNKRDLIFVSEAEALRENVRAWLYVTYQPFESLSACTRPLSISKERSRRGHSSAKWKYRVADRDPSDGVGQIAEGISGSDRDWTGFRAIHWSAYSDHPFRGEWWVLSSPETGFTIRFTHKGKGWQDFRVELASASKFGKLGKPTWSFVRSLALQIESSQDADIYLDDIVLERPKPVKPTK